jgi:hypothetical protein
MIRIVMRFVGTLIVAMLAGSAAAWCSVLVGQFVAGRATGSGWAMGELMLFYYVIAPVVGIGTAIGVGVMLARRI